MILASIFWELLGPPWGSFWRLIAESVKTMDFEYLPRENLDFEGSGRSFLELFQSKIVKKMLSARNRPK